MQYYLDCKTIKNYTKVFSELNNYNNKRFQNKRDLSKKEIHNDFGSFISITCKRFYPNALIINKNLYLSELK